MKSSIYSLCDHIQTFSHTSFYPDSTEYLSNENTFPKYKIWNGPLTAAQDTDFEIQQNSTVKYRHKYILVSEYSCFWKWKMIYVL